ncbi:MAG: hypothetical protein JETCAE02_26850 [Anaerolineaceae bacterium]|nr:MAG: hypothetical protein JETCAE02_26850 [Anaerolineaceae bacterium]
MTREEFAAFVADIAGMYPAWARHAASDAYTDRLYDCVAGFDYIDLIETARALRRIDIDAERPNFKAIVAETWKHANKSRRLDDDGVCVRIVRADALKHDGVDLAQWTDCEVWRWWLYTAADWRTCCALSGQAYPGSWRAVGAMGGGWCGGGCHAVDTCFSVTMGADGAARDTVNEEQEESA